MKLELSVLDETGQCMRFKELRQCIDESGCPDIRTENRDRGLPIALLPSIDVGISPMIIETAFTVILASPVVVGLVKCLRTYLQTRKPGVRVQIKVGDKKIIVDAGNLADAQALLEQLHERPEMPTPSFKQPRLLVVRGQKRNVEYPLHEGQNYIGRADEKPVDIDLEEQEPPDRICCSRRHACISFEENQMAVEDLNSANGTYVNRTRVSPGQKRPLAVNDVIQIGNIQLKVVV